MMGLIKNETKMFFSTKNIIILIISCIIVVFMFYKTYEKQYEEYPQKHLQKLSAQIDDAIIWVERRENRLNIMLSDYPGYPTIPIAQRDLELNKAHLKDVKTLSFLWKEPEDNKQKIININQRIDARLKEVKEKQIDIYYSLMYMDVERDWNQRCMLSDKYKELDIEPDINPLKPTAIYLLNDSINGTSYISLLVIILIILFNFDIWSKDFDNETVRLIFTLPYSKTRIFNIRFLTRFILSLFSVTIPIMVLSCIGLYKYGLGANNFTVINSKGLSNFSRFDIANEFLQDYDVVVSLGKVAIYSSIVFVLFLLLVYLVVTFLSYTSRSQQISVLISMVGIVMISVVLLVPADTTITTFNIIRLIDINRLLSGALGLSWIWVLGILLLINTMLYFINTLYVKYKE